MTEDYARAEERENIARHAMMIVHYRLTGRWHQALDYALACLDQHGRDNLTTVRDLLMIGQLMLAANRPSAARSYLERAKDIVLHQARYITEHPDLVITLATELRASGSPTTRRLLDAALALLVDVDDHAAARVRLLIPTTTAEDQTPHQTIHQRGLPAVTRSGDGPLFVLPTPELVLSPTTYRLLADAQETVGRLDEIIQRCPLRSSWARSVQMREIQHSAHLDGVHVALREVVVAHLPGHRGEQAIEPDLAEYLRSTGLVLSGGAAACVDLLVEQTAAVAAGGGSGGGNTVLRRLLAWANDTDALPVLARLALATCYLQVSGLLRGRAGHVGRLYLGTELVRGGLLGEPWFPLSTWIDAHHEQYREQIDQAVATGEFDQFVGCFARGVARTCRSELALLEDLSGLRERLLAALPNGRRGRIRDIVTSLVAIPMINHRWVTEHYGVSMRSATDITASLVEHGLVVLSGGARYGKVFCCAEALQMLVTPDAT